MRIKRYLAVLLALICSLAAILCFSGCTDTQSEAKPTQEVVSTIHSDMPTLQPTPAPAETEAPTPNASDAYEFELDYHRASSVMYRVLGENVISAVHTIVDAFTAGETSVDLSEFRLQDDFDKRLTVALNSLFPPFVAFTNYTVGKGVDDNGMLSWELFIEKDEIANKLSSFEKKVKDYMRHIEDGDPEVVRAILIYSRLANFSSYDYLIGELELQGKQNSPEYILRISGYNAITRNIGICFSYAYALTFLYVQAGLDCIPIWSEGGIGSHGWVAVKLFDEYVYCDPTWDLSRGLVYFGMSSFERQSDFGGGYLTEVSHIIGPDTCVDDYFEVAEDSSMFVCLRGFYERPGIEVDRENGIIYFSTLDGMIVEIDYMRREE